MGWVGTACRWPWEESWLFSWAQAQTVSCSEHAGFMISKVSTATHFQAQFDHTDDPTHTHSRKRKDLDLYPK